MAQTKSIADTRFSVTMLGALLIFLGAAILTNFDDVTIFLTRLIGFSCSIFALLMFLRHFVRAHALDAIPFEQLLGAGALLFLGAVIALFPTMSSRVLCSALGMLIVLSGIADIMRSKRMVADDDQKERMTLRIGIATVATGLFVAFVPAAAQVVLIICGLALLLDGVSELYLALRMS